MHFYSEKVYLWPETGKLGAYSTPGSEDV